MQLQVQKAVGMGYSLKGGLNEGLLLQERCGALGKWPLSQRPRHHTNMEYMIILKPEKNSTILRAWWGCGPQDFCVTADSRDSRAYSPGKGLHRDERVQIRHSMLRIAFRTHEAEATARTAQHKATGRSCALE